MTTPNDPLNPQGTPPPYGQPPVGNPAPGYGTPQGYGAPAGYGAVAPPPMGGMPQLASWGARVGATLIDALLVFAIIIVTLIIGSVLGSGVSEGLGIIVLVLGYLAAIGFGFWNEYRMGATGQSIGKKQVGISVRKEADGSFIGGWMGIARRFIHIIDGIPCYIGYFWPLWDAKKQTFTDKVMSTVVVRV